ncbi:YueI family protein [Bacillus sp. B1-b2]|uniref:YueI family protein n=1 Tax=Bacillus sp. B1-b2 TaxID=2653201 RepID=UPI001261FECC|nr:YueI family protein [Bacillus sp. B1-b2]KAB7672454.1 YueI family protein [Bacillus sp. B1-b2]
MSDPNLDDYLQKGMYGAKETKPEERRKFLGSLRERVVIALTQAQVIEKKVYTEIEEAIKSNSGAKLYLNGHLDYSYLSKYMKVANQLKMEYTIVTNKDGDSEIGLLIAYDHAIDKDEIYVKESSHETEHEFVNQGEKTGFFSTIGKWFSK